jgi:outer membrane protein assembly factor BamB
VLWRASLGTGFSSLSIRGGRVYSMGNANEQDTVWCLDARNGNLVWKHTYPAALGPQYYEGGPGSTPTIDDGRVFTIAKWGKIFCLDAARGAVLWQHDLGADGVKSNRWGFAGSALIWNDLVIFNAGETGVALERKTGRVAWLNGLNPTGYASPKLFKLGGKEMILIFAAKHLVAVEPRTGRELWRFFWETNYDTNNPDPILYDDKILISSYSRGCALLTVKNGQPEVVYENKNLFNHLSPGIVQGEYLFAFNGQAKEKSDFRCLHLPTGDVKWTKPDPAMGSVISAQGQLIVLSEKGELLLAEASPADFKPVARAQILGGLCWTPPALADGRLYARNAAGTLVCVQLTQQGESAAR